MPRLRLVTHAVPSTDPKADLETIDHRAAALVPTGLGLAGGGEPGVVRLVSDRPGRLRLVTDSTSRQLLVVADRYHPGWRVRVDGRESPPVRVNGDFLGCVVEPGRHRVVLRFDPWSHRAGRAMSLSGLLLTAATLPLTVWPWPRRRRPATAADTAILPAPHLGMKDFRLSTHDSRGADEAEQ
jgi:hypothetical protein